MITFKQAANIDALTDWKRACLQTLVAPLDGYWQTAIIDPAPHYLILVNGRARLGIGERRISASQPPYEGN